MTLLALLLAASLTGDAGTRVVADSLLRHGFYAEATSELRRSADSSANAPHSLRLGLSLGATGDLPRAAVALREAADADTTLVWPARMSLAGLYAARREWSRSRFELSDLLLATQDSTRRQELLLGCAWLDLADHDLASATACVEQAGRADLARDARGIASRRGRSPTLAAVMSSIVPGLGETYAGRPLPGLLSLLVTGGSAYAAYRAARSDDWVLASALVSLFFLRFYNGSRQNAVWFAQQYNRRQVEDGVQQLQAKHLSEPDWFAGVRPLVGDSFPPRPDSAAR